MDSSIPVKDLLSNLSVEFFLFDLVNICERIENEDHQREVVNKEENGEEFLLQTKVSTYPRVKTGRVFESILSNFVNQ